MENRWFTKTGRAKRIPKKLEGFRFWANENKNLIMNYHTLYIVKSIRETWDNLELADSCNLMVYLIGCYSTNHEMFTSERYKAGEIVAKSLVEKPFNIRTLELVK